MPYVSILALYLLISVKSAKIVGEVIMFIKAPTSKIERPTNPQSKHFLFLKLANNCCCSMFIISTDIINPQKSIKAAITPSGVLILFEICTIENMICKIGGTKNTTISSIV